MQAELQRRERELVEIVSGIPPRMTKKVCWWSAALTVDQVRQALPAESIILEYFQIQDRIVVVLLSQDQLEIVPLANLSEMMKSIAKLSVPIVETSTRCLST